MEDKSTVSLRFASQSVMKELANSKMEKIASDYPQLKKVYEKYKLEVLTSGQTQIPLDYIFVLPKRIKSVMIKKHIEKMITERSKTLEQEVNRENTKRANIGDQPMNPD